MLNDSSCLFDDGKIPTAPHVLPPIPCSYINAYLWLLVYHSEPVPTPGTTACTFLKRGLFRMPLHLKKKKKKKSARVYRHFIRWDEIISQGSSVTQEIEDLKFVMNLTWSISFDTRYCWWWGYKNSAICLPNVGGGRRNSVNWKTNVGITLMKKQKQTDPTRTIRFSGLEADIFEPHELMRSLRHAAVLRHCFDHMIPHCTGMRNGLVLTTDPMSIIYRNTSKWNCINDPKGTYIRDSNIYNSHSAGWKGSPLFGHNPATLVWPNSWQPNYILQFKQNDTTTPWQRTENREPKLL